MEPANYAAIFAGGRPALAWELLRRDPAYIAAANGYSVGSLATVDFERKWGLHFR